MAIKKYVPLPLWLKKKKEEREKLLKEEIRKYLKEMRKEA